MRLAKERGLTLLCALTLLAVLGTLVSEARPRVVRVQHVYIHRVYVQCAFDGNSA